MLNMVGEDHVLCVWWDSLESVLEGKEGRVKETGWATHGGHSSDHTLANHTG